MTKIFVLVGTNPIPCYISAVYLLIYYSECELFLVCSEDNPPIKQAGTCKIGERIKKQINELFPDIRTDLLSIKDVGSKSSIISTLDGKYSAEDEIHLSYTGGTKSMAALTYNVLSPKENFSSSYLDGRRHIMIMDGDPALSNDHDLRKNPDIKLDLKAITTLHGFNEVEDKNIYAQYLGLLEGLKSLLHDKQISKIYGHGNAIKKTPELSANEEKEIAKKREEFIQAYIKSRSISLDEKAEIVKNREDIFKECIQKCEISAQAEEETSKNREEITQASMIREKLIDKKKEKHIKEYIDGDWLEHYLYEELLKLTGEPKDIELYFNVNKHEGFQFQIDLIAIYGYQMTLISVTTHEAKGLCKQKAFEAIHRARQLGGDEAKIILVTFMGKVNELEQDVWDFFGSTIPGFKAFGIGDFYDGKIFKKIIDYIKE